MNLLGKRLLLLGGSIWKKVIKDYAKQNGIILIAVGSNKNSGIFEIADECYNVDSTDIDAMKRLIIDRHIDGVYMGSNEQVVRVACQYVNDLGLPCYCNLKQWDTLQNKAKFKDICKESGLPVVPSYDVDIDNLEKSKALRNFPVITKPIDGCGSQGFSVCNNLNELKSGYIKACQASDSGNAIVEKFVQNSAVGVFYTFSNGNVIFSGIEDKYAYKIKGHESYVGGLFIFESKLKDDFRKKFDKKIAIMFNKLGIKEGTIWIEVFTNGKDFYFNECGFRYGGTISIYPIDYFYQINQVASDIHFALTGKSKIYDHSPIIQRGQRKKHYAMIPVYINSGVISSITGMEKLFEHDNIIVFPQRYSIGAMIKNDGTFFQCIGVFHFVFDTAHEFRDTVKYMLKTVKILDSDGNNMILPLFNVDTDTFIFDE